MIHGVRKTSTAKASNANARIEAGLATDIATSFDTMAVARTAALCDALGAPIGSLHTHHRTAKTSTRALRGEP